MPKDWLFKRRKKLQNISFKYIYNNCKFSILKKNYCFILRFKFWLVMYSIVLGVLYLLNYLQCTIYLQNMMFMFSAYTQLYWFIKINELKM